MSFRVPEKYRVVHGPMRSDASFGNNGAFRIPNRRGGAPLMVIASDQAGWDHVSVSLSTRCPTWAEMDRIKRLFWDDDDAVMQLHVPRDKHVNNHSHCLHLWRPLAMDIPVPPAAFVGVLPV